MFYKCDSATNAINGETTWKHSSEENCLFCTTRILQRFRQFKSIPAMEDVNLLPGHFTLSPNLADKSVQMWLMSRKSPILPLWLSGKTPNMGKNVRNKRKEHLDSHENNNTWFDLNIWAVKHEACRDKIMYQKYYLNSLLFKIYIILGWVEVECTY